MHPCKWYQNTSRHDRGVWSMMNVKNCLRALPEMSRFWSDESGRVFFTVDSNSRASVSSRWVELWNDSHLFSSLFTMAMPYEDESFDPNMMMMMPNSNVEELENDEMYMSDSQLRFPSALEKALDLKSERIRERVAGEPIPGKIFSSLCVIDTLVYDSIL